MCPGKNARDHNIKLNATINVHPNCRHKIFTMRARHVKQLKKMYSTAELPYISFKCLQYIFHSIWFELVEVDLDLLTWVRSI